MGSLELLIPLTYIPGVALLIMSTSQRYMKVNGIISAFTPEECKIKTERVRTELRRAHLFRNSPIGLYISVAFFTVGAFIAYLIHRWEGSQTTAQFVLESFLVLGVISIIFAVMTLDIESILSLELIKSNAKSKGYKEDE